MTAAGKSKFWKIKSIESRWAQFDLEVRDSRTLMYTDDPQNSGYKGSLIEKSPWISKKPFILHLIEWHKKVISFSEWRCFRIDYPSNQRPANQKPANQRPTNKEPTKIRAHQRPGANVKLLPAKNVAQESLSNEVIVMPLEDGVTKLEPNDNECFEVPVQVIPSTDTFTNQRLSSIPQPKQVQTVPGRTNEKSAQKRKSEIICIADEYGEKKRISDNYISNVKDAMNQFIQTYHLSTRKRFQIFERKSIGYIGYLQDFFPTYLNIKLSLLRTDEMKNFLSTVLSLGNVPEDEINRMIDILAERT